MACKDYHKADLVRALRIEITLAYGFRDRPSFCL